MLKTRTILYCGIFCMLWPMLTLVFALSMVTSEGLFSGAPLWVLVTGLVVGLLQIAPETLQCGLLLGLACAFSARILCGSPGRASFPDCWRLTVLAEPLLFAWALSSGIILEYPALLRHPIFVLFCQHSVFLASFLLVLTPLLTALLVGRRRGGRWMSLRYMVFVAAWVLAGWICAHPFSALRIEAGSNTNLILGLDSLSQSEDLQTFRDFAREQGGTWFDRPVTPALLTNPVWNSILSGKPVSETGVFFLFQQADWEKLPNTVLKRAHKAGLTTISFFSDQFTAPLGSLAGFDYDRSGPIGWRQPSTAFLKNASIFLPVLLYRLPSLPAAGTPRNQSGTYAYDLEREIMEILSAGKSYPRSLVAAHLDYLHQPRYPGFSEMTPEERRRVRAARVCFVADSSLHWQYPDQPEEPLGIYRWKISHLQKIVTRSIVESRFLDPGKDNRLVLFSDHGPRLYLNENNFGEERFHRVPLIGFRTKPRDTRKPLSLIDIADLIGLPDPDRPGSAEPIVEYVSLVVDDYSRLMEHSTPLLDGRVQLDSDVMLDMVARLRGYNPYADRPYYFPVAIKTNYLKATR